MDALDIPIHLVETLDEAFEFKRWMSERRPFVAIDTETAGLKFWRHPVRLVQIGDTREAWCIPWFKWAGLIYEVLEAYDGDIVMHNAKFDVLMLESSSDHVDFKPGFKLPRHKIHDTCIMANILDPSKPVGLKPLATRFLHQQLSQDESMLSNAMDVNGWGWESVPPDFPPYWLYGGLDAVRTARLYEKLRPIVEAEAPRAYEVEMATTWVLLDMERKGMEVDTEFAAKITSQKEQEIEDLAKRCREEFSVSPGQNDSVISKLQELTDYEFSKTTDKGKLSLDKEVLEDVIHKTEHPLAKMVLERRRKQKVTSSYLRRFSPTNEFNLLGTDGRIHPNFNGNTNYGARTGRMTVSNPPLQQLPRSSFTNQDANAVRQCLVASNLGETHALVMCDFDQIEARIFASVSQDWKLIEAFKNTDQDFFTTVARDIYGDPTLDKKDPRRQTTKNTIYTKLFGGGNEKAAITAGVPVAQIDAFMDRFNSLYPGYSNLVNRVVDTARRRWETEGTPYVRSLLNKRKLPADSVDKAYVLTNYLIQASAAEVLKQKNLEIHKAGLGKYLVLNVHDEVILDVPRDEDIGDIARTVEGIMNDDTLFETPLTAESTVSWCWGLKETEHADKPGSRPVSG